MCNEIMDGHGKSRIYRSIDIQVYVSIRQSGHVDCLSHEITSSTV